jgi:beta-1,4-N-acetylglucosaminyltransferase
MFKLLNGINLSKINKIEFIVADTDKMSIFKIEDFEKQHKNKNLNLKTSKIKRSRNVGQSYFTAIFTTLIAIIYSIPLIIKSKPDLLLVNGPGTCIPISLVIFLFSRVLHIIPRCKIIFIESICRVEKLSLSGKLLYTLRIIDYMIVQWPELNKIYPSSIYIGQLV